MSEDGGGGEGRSIAGARGRKRGGVVTEGWQGEAELVEVTVSEEERCEHPGYKQTLPDVRNADHVLPPNWGEMKESQSVCLREMAKYPEFFERGEEVNKVRVERYRHLLTWGTAVLLEFPRTKHKVVPVRRRAVGYVRGYVVTESKSKVRVVLDDGTTFVKLKTNVYWYSLAVQHGDFEAVVALKAEYRACREHQVAERSDVVWLPREDVARDEGAGASAGVEMSDGEDGRKDGEPSGGGEDVGEGGEHEGSTVG